MKIYGSGLLLAPGTDRVVWDFTDGPFETVNGALIEAAKKQGFSLDAEPKAPEVKPEAIVTVKRPRKKG
jgi:hypothetical protein